MSKRRKSAPDKATRDNRANQLNPNHPAYWSSRGEAPPPAPKEAPPPEPPPTQARESEEWKA